MPRAENGPGKQPSSSAGDRGALTVETLSAEIAAGQIDTVELVVVDMQGRLQGKRLTARYFLDSVLSGGSEARQRMRRTR